MRAASLHDLHRATGIPKPTLTRILYTLYRQGLVWQRMADGAFLPSHLMLQRGRLDDTAWLVEIASPVLERLCERVMWPSVLSVPRRRSLPFWRQPYLAAQGPDAHPGGGQVRRRPPHGRHHDRGPPGRLGGRGGRECGGPAVAAPVPAGCRGLVSAGCRGRVSVGRRGRGSVAVAGWPRRPPRRTCCCYVTAPARGRPPAWGRSSWPVSART